MANLKEIAAALAILSAGTLTLSGCKKEETANPDDVKAEDSAGAEGGEAAADGAAEGDAAADGAAEGEAACSGEKTDGGAEGEAACSGEKAEGEASCSGEKA
ncbi:hypothetical protein ACNOYE_20275 [Nannocystaceae bacterium ST9]